MTKPLLPTELCRFRSFASSHKAGHDEAAVYELLRGRFLFAAVETFNDPFEARPHFIPAFKNAAQQRGAMTRYIARIAPVKGSPTKRRRWAEEKLSRRSMWELVEELNLKEAATELKALCLMAPDAYKTPLPWSHYADSHQGVCIHFDTNEFPLNSAQPVEYESEYPQIPVPRRDDQNWEIMQAIILRKCPDWSYEREFRVVRMEPVARSSARWDGDVAKGSPRAAVSITLGVRMPDKVRTRLIDWVEDNTPHVEVWKAELHRSRYEIGRTLVRGSNSNITRASVVSAHR